MQVVWVDHVGPGRRVYHGNDSCVPLPPFYPTETEKELVGY